MSIESIFRSRLATLAILLVIIAVAAVGRRTLGEQPISLTQPTTTLVVSKVANKEPTAASQPTTNPAPQLAKQRIAPGAPFTPHYLCLCPPYCPKPMPCVDCCYKCCPDCYCSKPMPCPNPCYKCTCDDYCAKPMPCRFPQPLCGPRSPCRQSDPLPLYAPLPPRGPCMGP